MGRENVQIKQIKETSGTLGIGDVPIFVVLHHISHHDGFEVIEFFSKERDAENFCKKQTHPARYYIKKGFLR